MSAGTIEATTRSATRRRIIGGAAASAALVLLDRAPLAAGATATGCAGRPPGVRRIAIALTPDARTLWTADTGAATISAHRTRDLHRRRSIDVGDGPVAIAIAPDGERALVTTGFYDAPGLAIVDLRAGKVLERLDVGPSPGAVAIHGRTAVVASGGADGRLTRIDLERGRVMGRVDVGRDPRGVAIGADGRHALVALNGDAQVAVVALRDDRVTGRIATRPFPFLVAAAPHGDQAYVSHNGLGAASVSRLDAGARRTAGSIATGPDPAGLAFTAAGALLVATRGDGAVSLHDPRSGRRHRRIPVGGHPRALAVHGRRAFAADELTGQLWSVRT